MCLQNSKASGISNRCHQLRPREIRAHRSNDDWSSDSEAFTKPSLQHATSLSSLYMRGNALLAEAKLAEARFEHGIGRLHRYYARKREPCLGEQISELPLGPLSTI